MIKTTLEITKILRETTEISLALCNEAAKESGNNLEKALVLLKNKCIKVGEKYYKNPEKKVLFYSLLYKEEANSISFIKIGCQSDFLIASHKLKIIMEWILQRDITSTVEEDTELEMELKYNSGLVRENIELLYREKINKQDDEKFLIFSSLCPSNRELFNRLTILRYRGNFDSVDEEKLKKININTQGVLKKKIINILLEDKLHFKEELLGNKLEEFMNKPMVTDKETTLKGFIKSIDSSIEINGIFVV